jgi:hypothetical protein
MSWREHSKSVIRQAVTELSPTIPDANELFKHISLKYYPFGERDYHPYKQWLKVLADEKKIYVWKNKPKTETENVNVGMFE